MRPDPTHATSARAGRKLTDAELAVFLKRLAATGNFAFAAQCIGRVPNGLYKRRKRDPLFDAKCVEALARFRERGHAEPKGGEGARAASGTLRLVPARGGRPAQFRRVPAGSLTAAGEADFLAAFSATGNVRLAAASVGISPSTIHRRRALDADFARRFEEAADIASAALQSLMFERASRTFDEDYRKMVTGEMKLAEQDRVSVTEVLRFVAWLDRKGRR
ncbi:hypothetical protein WJS89_04145 [Sphingomicrobium sp. XHP0235]|uniref:hypothetical protein n=1 Tax=Sphingomicrobium aquimarinum TaxID=3133971 RepID=UPI0031FE6BA8